MNITMADPLPPEQPALEPKLNEQGRVDTGAAINRSHYTKSEGGPIGTLPVENRKSGTFESVVALFRRWGGKGEAPETDASGPVTEIEKPLTEINPQRLRTTPREPGDNTPTGIPPKDTGGISKEDPLADTWPGETSKNDMIQPIPNVADTSKTDPVADMRKPEDSDVTPEERQV